MSTKIRVFHLLHIAHASLFRAADRVMRSQEGITTAHQVILFTLNAEDGLSASEVAKRAGHSKSRLTNLVDTLESREMVQRRTSDADRRVYTLHITKSGRELIRRHTKRIQKMNEHILAPFDTSERKVISDFLEHVRREAEKI